MDDRIIKARVRGNSIHLLDCLSSLFATELLSPSAELYLISSWLSNVTLIDNRFGQFRAICPEMNKDILQLADILLLLADRGAQVRIMTRPDHGPTMTFLSGLAHQKNIECRLSTKPYEEGILTSQFYLHGSINFTYSGVSINSEYVEVSKDPDKLYAALHNAHLHWEEVEHDAYSL
jgi:hypothetical protein